MLYFEWAKTFGNDVANTHSHFLILLCVMYLSLIHHAPIT